MAIDPTTSEKKISIGGAIFAILIIGVLAHFIHHEFLLAKAKMAAKELALPKRAVLINAPYTTTNYVPVIKGYWTDVPQPPGDNIDWHPVETDYGLDVRGNGEDSLRFDHPPIDLIPWQDLPIPPLKKVEIRINPMSSAEMRTVRIIWTHN